ncbi:hypothetical protein [Streptomyces xanthochromogenes]
MSDFMGSYALWRSLPFPGLRRGENLLRAGENLALIHGDLALADEHVTQVILFVDEGVFRPSQADVIGLLEGVISRLERFGENLAAEERAVVDTHYQYAVLLHKIYAEFLRIGAP